MISAVPESAGLVPPFPLVGVGVRGRELDTVVRFVGSLSPTGTAILLQQAMACADAAVLEAALATATSLPVRRARDGEQLTPNVVFVLPPGCAIVLSDGVIRIARDDASPAEVLDALFCALAEERGARSIGILMRPHRSAGFRGLRAIRDAGGATYVERTPWCTARPDVRVTGGYAHLYLSAAEIARALPRAWDGDHAEDATVAEDAARWSMRDETLAQLLAEMRLLHGLPYRREVVDGQVAHRMHHRGVATLGEYARLLTDSSAERDELLRAILIGSTSFFRDAEVFEALHRSTLPSLLARMPRLDGHRRELRVWVAGCSTGEEAYSYAILLSEVLRERGEPAAFRIFASDLRRDAIEQARAGVYPREALSMLTAAQIDRYFVERSEGLTVEPLLRSKVFFCHHDLMTDPAFAHLDILSCRNLFVYYDVPAQRRALLRFHYALRPQGLLVLGGSESPRAASALFQPLDYLHRVYLRRQVAVPFQESLRAWEPPPFRIGRS